MYFENKVSEHASQLRNKNRENDNIRMELDQMMKYYDSANGQVNQMEMALEKVRGNVYIACTITHYKIN